MVKISHTDFKKFIKLMNEQGQDGAPLKFSIVQSNLHIETHDRQNKSMEIVIADTDYPHMPTVTRTETF